MLTIDTSNRISIDGQATALAQGPGGSSPGPAGATS